MVNPFAPLLDFSQWDIAIQSFFCDPVQGGGLFVAPPDNADATRENWNPGEGLYPFFTGFQAQVFQKQRPRVDLQPMDVKPSNTMRKISSDGRLWPDYWTTPLGFDVITKADYATHCQFLATVRAIISQMRPVAYDVSNSGAADLIQTTGLNAFLTVHELARIDDLGGPTFGGYLSTDKGYFYTPLKYQATFAVRISAWPGEILNA